MLRWAEVTNMSYQHHLPTPSTLLPMTLPTSPRQRFKSNQDWHNFIQELQKKAGEAAAAGGNPAIQLDLLALRLACYRDIETRRNRPLLVYASKFVNVPPLPLNVPIPNNIDLSDIEGFTDMINVMPEDVKSVDILIHSPGGKPDATERLVTLLRNRFEEVHFLIPHSAYSAATMLALSGNTITLHPSATLGPIDPQINGRPARSIKRGFEKVRDQLKTAGAASLPAYIPLLEKLSLDILEVCDDSETLSKDLVRSWLKEYMLKVEKYDNQIEEVVTFFSNYESHLLHSRPIVLSKLSKFQIEARQADKQLAELLWEAYILLEQFFQLTNTVKVYENTRGVSWGRQLNIQIQGQITGKHPVPGAIPPKMEWHDGE